MSVILSVLSHADTIAPGRVRLGGYAPSLSTADTSKVRLGGYAPSLSTADTSKVRLGGYAPSLSTTDTSKVPASRRKRTTPVLQPKLMRCHLYSRRRLRVPAPIRIGTVSECHVRLAAYNDIDDCDGYLNLPRIR
jgi:hypothetical protein